MAEPDSGWNDEKPPLQRLVDITPLFAERGRSFTAAAGAAVVEQDESGVRLSVALRDGGTAELLAQATASGALRLRWKARQDAVPPVDESDGMLGDGALPGRAEVSTGADCIALRTDGWTWRLTPSTLRWELLRNDRVVLRQQCNDWTFNSAISRPMGTTRGEGVRTWSYESFELQPDERLYGLGQQYGALQKRGTRTVLWNRDALGVNATPLSYHNVPFVWSSAGWGAVVHTGGRVACELGTPAYGTATLAADGEVLDLFLLTAGDGPGMLRAFYDLAGAPPEIEPWALGVWMSRFQYTSRAEVFEVAQRLDEIGMPVDVIHLDPAWMKRHHDYKYEYGSDFTWNDEGFGEAAEFFAAMRQRRLRVSLWESPYALHGSPAQAALQSFGGVAHDDATGTAAVPDDIPESGVITDFTSRKAREWWAARQADLVALGAAAFKTDFAEGVPDTARFGDGRTGAQIHNLYALLYNRTVFEAERAAGVARPLVFGRSGWLGSHRYPLQWSGDARSTWEDMRGALRAALSAALSGTAYWASDAGGFYTVTGAVDPELYARWAWMACLSAITRFHGMSPREPYAFPAEACDAAVLAARLRYALLPYLVAALPRGRSTDLPLMRPLLLEWPDDAHLHDEATEYLLGPDLLVAPVVTPGGRRSVHLPEGRWHDWWTGRSVHGPVRLDVEAPLGRVPLYQRGGSVIPLGRGMRVEEVLGGPVTPKRADQPWLPDQPGRG